MNKLLLCLITVGIANIGAWFQHQGQYLDKFDEEPNQVSILAYDALGLIYYCWFNNNAQFKTDQLYNKDGFRGLHGEFIISDNLSIQKLKIYKISEKKFLEVY